MNLPAELHRLTGRMRKARRRGLPVRAAVLPRLFACGVGWLASALLQPRPWAAFLSLAATAAWMYAIRSEKRAHLYQRVVDRCQGAILAILALNHQGLEEAFVRGRASRIEGDKRRWS